MCSTTAHFSSFQHTRLAGVKTLVLKICEYLPSKKAEGRAVKKARVRLTTPNKLQNHPNAPPLTTDQVHSEDN